MTDLYDVAAIGNAIVDVIAPSSEEFIAEQELPKGGMTLIDDLRADQLYEAMAPGQEASGGSAANTIAGIASFGGRGAFIGKVGDDGLGKVFAHDIRAIGAHYDTQPLDSGAATGRCLINVTPDGQRTMATFLGAANLLGPGDVDAKVIESAKITFLEGYLFTPDEARKAFAKAAGLARANDRLIALTLSAGFVVEMFRETLIEFIETQVDILFANEEEITGLWRANSFEEAVAATRPHVKIAALTCGAEGSVVIGGDEGHKVSAEPIDRLVDTTGAGDAYAAGFLYGLAKGRPLNACGRLGGIAAAEVISHYGARPETSLRDLAIKAGL
jgi:sugar/nucleoside kinase (ribokinase family)